MNENHRVIMYIYNPWPMKNFSISNLLDHIMSCNNRYSNHQLNMYFLQLLSDLCDTYYHKPNLPIFIFLIDSILLYNFKSNIWYVYKCSSINFFFLAKHHNFCLFLSIYKYTSIFFLTVIREKNWINTCFSI